MLSQSITCYCLLGELLWAAIRFTRRFRYTIHDTLALILYRLKGNVLLQGLFLFIRLQKAPQGERLDKDGALVSHRLFLGRGLFFLILLLAGQGKIPWAFGLPMEENRMEMMVNGYAPSQSLSNTVSLGLSLMSHTTAEVIAQADVQRHAGQQKPYLFDFATNTKGIINAQTIIEIRDDEMVLAPVLEESIAKEEEEPKAQTCESKAILDTTDEVDSQQSP